jgi:hypothetical protein
MCQTPTSDEGDNLMRTVLAGCKVGQSAKSVFENGGMRVGDEKADDGGKPRIPERRLV